MNDILWLGHSGVLALKSSTVYIDPFDLPGDDWPKADLILLTHPHFDHCSKDDVGKVSAPGTVVAGFADCLSRFELERRPLRPGESQKFSGVQVTALPAYTKRKPYHPRENGWLGFLVEFDGLTLYHAGDADDDCLHGLGALRADVALLPVDDIFTMNADEAARAAGKLECGLVVPIHFGSVCGRKSEAGKFVVACRKAGLAAELPKRAEGGLRAPARGGS